MISGKERFKQLIEEGRKGKNIGLTIGSKKLERYMDGYLPGTSYLIGGSSGSGKSTYALWALVYCPLVAYLNGIGVERDPYWIMFSLEMTPEQIYAKLVSMYIYDKFGVQLRFKEIFSRGEDCILSDEHLELINAVDNFIDVLDQRLWFYEGFLTESVYIDTMKEQIKRFGTNQNGKYIPNNPQQVVGVLIDHCSLIKASQGRSKKDEMDAISRDSVMYRNKTGIISPIHIAQFNRSSNSDERLKQAMQDPNQSDFKDSGALKNYDLNFFFNKFNINTTVHKGNVLYILSESVDTFTNLVKDYIHPDCLYKLHMAPKNSVKQGSSNLDNPVLNPQETEENAERLEVMPNE